MTRSMARLASFCLLCLIPLLVARSFADVESMLVTEAVIQKVKDQYGRRAANRISRWDGVIEKNREEDLGIQLRQVNDYFNSIPYATDPRHWGLPDYWATPIEMLATNGGDCEDYSIAKYFTLRALGVPDEDLRITYVNALELGQAHMVLTYYGSSFSDPLVLDNINTEILPASTRDDLQPVYTFNGESMWMARERGRGLLVGKSESLDQWAGLLERLQLFNRSNK